MKNTGFPGLPVNRKTGAQASLARRQMGLIGQGVGPRSSGGAPDRAEKSDFGGQFEVRRHLTFGTELLRHQPMGGERCDLAVAESARRLYQLLRSDRFFLSVKGLGYESAPSSWYEGTPFSALDFPILHFGTKDVEIVGCILVWPRLTTIPYAMTFLPMLPVNQPLIPSPATSAGPVVPTSAMGNFSANSPTGVQTFQAKYIMYSPFGPNPLGGVYTSASGIQFDMILYSWWYNF